MNRITLFFVSLFFILGGTAIAANSEDQYDTNTLDKYKYLLNGNTQHWPKNNDYSQNILSTVRCADSQWEANTFTVTSTSSGLCTGFERLDHDASIKSLSKLSGDFNRIVLTIDLTNASQYESLVKTITLQFSENEDMSDCNTYKYAAKKSLNTNTFYYFFDFPKDESGKYCKIYFDNKMGADADGWLKVKEIRFYEKEIEPVDLVADTDNKMVQLKTNWGELHVATVEYDSFGNVVKEFPSPVSNSHNKARVIAEDNHTWTNKVAEQGETYTINAPATNGNYLNIRAKAVQDNMHSNEMVVRLNSAGVLTGSVMIEPDKEENETERWFDITGREVSQPQNGVYIVVKGNKSSKVLINK